MSPIAGRPVALTQAIVSAPTITPHTFPMPPRTTIASRMIEIEKLNRSAKTPFTWVAKATPPTPPDTAPIAYAANLERINGTPIMLAANSSSRIASHARPKRPLLIRSEIKTISAVSETNIKYFQSRSNGPKVFPNKPTLSTGAIPLDPFVKLKPPMFSPL